MRFMCAWIIIESVHVQMLLVTKWKKGDDHVMLLPYLKYSAVASMNSVCTIVKYCLSLKNLMCHFRAAYIKLNMQWKLSNRYDFFYL